MIALCDILYDRPLSAALRPEPGRPDQRVGMLDMVQLRPSSDDRVRLMDNKTEYFGNESIQGKAPACSLLGIIGRCSISYTFDIVGPGTEQKRVKQVMGSRKDECRPKCHDHVTKNMGCSQLSLA